MNHSLRWKTIDPTQRNPMQEGFKIHPCSGITQKTSSCYFQIYKPNRGAANCCQRRKLVCVCVHKNQNQTLLPTPGIVSLLPRLGSGSALQHMGERGGKVCLSHAEMGPSTFAEQSLLLGWGQAAGARSLTCQPGTMLQMRPAAGARKGARRGNLAAP